MKLVAAVEGGGTSFSVAICQASGGHRDNDNNRILHRLSVDSSTGDPATTLTRCALFLRKHGKISALGIACFGPIGLNAEDDKTFGRILSTSPKKAWRNVDILTPLLEACDHCPFLLDTDVNAPAALEFAMANHNHAHDDDASSIIEPKTTSTTIYSSPTTAAATTTAATTTAATVVAEKKKKKSITSCAYVTVGTGVGVGLVVNHQTVRGFLHPEGGHVPVPPLPGDTFGGYSWGQGAANVLPFGGRNTVEALASSVALVERYEQELAKIGALNATNNLKSRGELANVPDESDIWDHAVNAIATLCTTMILLLSVERIVLGGGVLQRAMLLGKIRVRTAELLNHYLPLDGPEDDALRLDRMIVVSAHGKDAGLRGAIHLAQRALDGGGDGPELTAQVKKMKQEAFHSGLWFGTALGAIGTGLLVRFWLFPTGKRR